MKEFTITLWVFEEGFSNPYGDAYVFLSTMKDIGLEFKTITTNTIMYISFTPICLKWLST
ncbi:MAG: hypothetical protein ACP5LT_04725 [Candidatus Kapaibacteriota bacterium]